MERLALEVWDWPEERKRLVEEALERWDEGVLSEGVWAYLVRHRKKPDKAVPIYVRHFVRWLVLRGRKWPRLEAGDVRAFLEEARLRGFPGSSVGPVARGTVERARGALVYFVRFLEWAGIEWPRHVEVPPRGFGEKITRRPMPEEEWQELLRKAEEYTPAYWRPVLKVLLVLVGEVGLEVKEALALWSEDFREDTLLVRGERLREVPLSPLARKTLEEWMPLRAYLATHQPLPYPQLLLSASKISRGKPLDKPEANWLLRQFWAFVGIRPTEGQSRVDPVRRLRWRAIRNYLAQGHPKEKVAYWTGMRSLVVPGFWEEG
jgi:integrase